MIFPGPGRRRVGQSTRDLGVRRGVGQGSPPSPAGTGEQASGQQRAGATTLELVDVELEGIAGGAPPAMKEDVVAAAARPYGAL
jgi:hypothetical protein